VRAFLDRKLIGMPDREWPKKTLYLCKKKKTNLPRDCLFAALLCPEVTTFFAIVHNFLQIQYKYLQNDLAFF
jgi:hypothetical protein